MEMLVTCSRRKCSYFYDVVVLLILSFLITIYQVQARVESRKTDKILAALTHTLEEAMLLQEVHQEDELQILYDIMAGKLFYIKQLATQTPVPDHDKQNVQDILTCIKEQYIKAIKPSSNIDCQSLDILCDEIILLLQRKEDVYE